MLFLPCHRLRRITPRIIWLYFLLIGSGCSFLQPQSQPPGAPGQPITGQLGSASITAGVAQLPSPELVTNQAVKNELAKFASQRNGIATELKRRAEFDSQIRQIFIERGVPIELINIAHLESGFRPDAKNKSGAAGLWQFMQPTAKSYGLRVNSFVDERLDVELSSIAAANHLRDLYKIYDDWWLALAAYNAGTGRVNRALKAAGVNCYWGLSQHAKQGAATKVVLPAETLRFVPKFIALTMYLSSLAPSNG